MSLDIFKTGTDVEVQEEKDSVGGFQRWETDLYRATLKAAFLGEYKAPAGKTKGSKYIEVVIELMDAEGNKLEHSEREVVWSANTEGAFYIDKKTGKKKQLIGLSKMNSLGMLLTGKKLETSVFETKVHKVYDADAKGEVNKELPTLTEWCGKPIHVGLLKVTENKQTKAGNKYVNTNEEREINVVDKYFDEDKRSLLEVQGDKPASFCEDWIAANQGKTRNKFKPVAGAAPVAGGVPQATAAPLTFNT